MKNDPLVAKLYNKMQQEQNEYRAWLLAQPPEEILNHAYEYSSREDILIALENASLRPAQLRALLESQAPLADIYKDYRDCDTNTLDVMTLCIADRADIDLMESTKKNWPPVYYQTGRYAREHEELPQYRASMKLNEECRDEIDDAISYNYNGLCLDDGAVQQVLAGYGAERTRYIVAAAIQVRDGDARISPQNRRWADAEGKLASFPLTGRCSIQRDCKLPPIRTYQKTLPQDTVYYLGIAADEPIRLARLKANQTSLLAKYNLTEKDAQAMCQAEGLLSPLYAFTGRGGCWFCPNASMRELRHLYNAHPDLWQLLLELQDAPNKATERFNRSYTLHDLDLRFCLEGEQLSLFSYGER